MILDIVKYGHPVLRARGKKLAALTPELEQLANDMLETMHEAYPDRFPLSPTLANYAAGNDEIVLAGDRRRSIDEIQEAVLEALADEIRHLLDEGVVGEPADVDTCLLLGAGWPFFLGGITPHLEQRGFSVSATRV